MPIDPLPQPPSRSDPQNFAARGDAFMAALPAFAAQANALQMDVNLKEEAATSAAVSASDDAQAAALAAGDAQSSKNAAANSASEAQTARDAALGYRNDAADSALAAANSAASVDIANLSSDYFGPTEPAITWPGMTWAHTTNPEMTEGYLKRRNAANTGWEVEGELFVRSANRNGDAGEKFKASPATESGDVVTFEQAFGVGQARQNLTSSRSLNTTYTNATGKMITVQVHCTITAASGIVTASVAGTPGQSATFPTTGVNVGVQFVVGNGESYRVDGTGVAITKWEEIR